MRHRRSWMLVTQAVIILGLWLIAGTDPTKALGAMAAFAVMVVVGCLGVGCSDHHQPTTDCAYCRRGHMAGQAAHPTH